MPALIGDIDDAVDALRQQAPQILGAPHAAGKPTADTDDCDRFNSTHARNSPTVRGLQCKNSDSGVNRPSLFDGTLAHADCKLARQESARKTCRAAFDAVLMPSRAVQEAARGSRATLPQENSACRDARHRQQGIDQSGMLGFGSMQRGGNRMTTAAVSSGPRRSRS